tara:strand:- start:265 stop:600 length:336 start_codon:yes stop_codon:yes gene_type:complete
MAQSTNLTVGQGETFKILVSLTDQNDTAINLTNYTFSGSLRETYSTEDTSTDFGFETISPAASGSFYVTLPPASSSLLASQDYVYDILLVSESVIRRIVEGKFTVRPSVTR